MMMKINTKRELMNFLISIGIEPIERGEELFAVCPYHQEEKPSFSISIKSHNFGTFFCFGCHTAGNIKTLISDFCDDKIALITLRKKISKKEQVKAKKFIIKGLPIEYKKINLVNFGSNYSQYKYFEYLLGRNIRMEQIIEHEIGFCEKGFYRGRIIIPIKIKGKVFSFAARSIRGFEKRYLYPKDSKVKDLVFPFDSIDFDLPYLILVEGIFDMLALERIGLKNVLCLFNNYVSKKQSRLIRRFNDIYYCPDPDEGGLLFLKQARKFSLFSNIHYIRLTSDPGGLSDKKLKEQLVKKNLYDIFDIEKPKVKINYNSKEL